MRRRNKGQEAFISKRRRQRLFVFVLEFLPHPDHRTAGPWLHWLAQLHIKEQHEGSIEQQGIFARLAVAEHAVQVCGSQTSRREATCWPFTLLSHSLSLSKCNISQVTAATRRFNLIAPGSNGDVGALTSTRGMPRDGALFCSEGRQILT